MWCDNNYWCCDDGVPIMILVADVMLEQQRWLWCEDVVRLLMMMTCRWWFADELTEWCFCCCDDDNGLIKKIWWLWQCFIVNNVQTALTALFHIATWGKNSYEYLHVLLLLVKLATYFDIQYYVVIVMILIWWCDVLRQLVNDESDNNDDIYSFQCYKSSIFLDAEVPVWLLVISRSPRKVISMERSESIITLSDYSG